MGENIDEVRLLGWMGGWVWGALPPLVQRSGFGVRIEVVRTSVVPPAQALCVHAMTPWATAQTTNSGMEQVSADPATPQGPAAHRLLSPYTLNTPSAEAHSLVPHRMCCVQVMSPGVRWLCPCCRYICNCSGISCQRLSRGLAATSQLKSEAKHLSYRSVSAVGLHHGSRTYAERWNLHCCMMKMMLGRGRGLESSTREVQVLVLEWCRLHFIQG